MRMPPDTPFCAVTGEPGQRLKAGPDGGGSGSPDGENPPDSSVDNARRLDLESHHILPDRPETQLSRFVEDVVPGGTAACGVPGRRIADRGQGSRR